jgi:PKD repeat protein
VTTGTASSLSFTPSDNGTYAVALTVVDGAGGEGSAAATITVNNVAPVVEAGANQAVASGQIVSLAASAFTDAGSADTHTATVNWGDGTPTHPVAVAETAGAGTIHASHVYAANGNYVVTLTVTDDDGGAASDTLTIAVGDTTPPVVSVDSLSTYDLTPPLTGHVDDPTASVLVTVNSVAYPASNHGDGTWAVADNVIAPLAEGTYDVHVTATDPAGNVGTDTTTNELRIIVPHVVARQIFYNNSYWDGNNVLANAADDAAIATDKAALLPGQPAGFANYTSYNKGINGIMIDVSDLPPGTPTTADFEFRMGNTATNPAPSAWGLVTATVTITVRRGMGVNNSDRITVTFTDNSILKQWLRVKVLAGGDVGLAAADVFYFGNAVAETLNVANDTKVTVLDISNVRTNQSPVTVPPAIDNKYDFNRDHKVNTADISLARTNQTPAGGALKLFTPVVDSQQGQSLPAAGGDAGLLASLPTVPLGAGLGDDEAATDEETVGGDTAGADAVTASAEMVSAGDGLAKPQAADGDQEFSAYATVPTVTAADAAGTTAATGAPSADPTTTMDALAATVEATTSPKLGASLGTALIDALAATALAAPL